MITRMKALGMNYSDIARRINVTRAAISHILTKGRQSALVPEITKAVGLSAVEDINDLVALQKDDLDRSDSFDLMMAIVAGADAVKATLTPNVMDLISKFIDLDEVRQHRILERIEVLWQEQMADSAKPPVKAGVRGNVKRL